MKRQYKERKYEPTKPEMRFEELLKNNGFNILGVIEYNSKTDYLIEKDNFACEYSIHRVDNVAKRGDRCYNLFNEFYDLKKRIHNRQ